MIRNLNGAEFVRWIAVNDDVVFLNRHLKNAEGKEIPEEERKKYVAMFRKDGENFLICWTINEKSGIRLDLGVPRINCYDIFGNSRALETDGGKITLSLSESPIYVRAVSPDVRTIPELLAVTVENRDLAKGTDVTVAIAVNNDTGLALRETAKITPPPGWDCEPCSIEIDCPPGQTKTCEAVLRVPENAPEGQHIFSAKMGGESAHLDLTVKKTAHMNYATTVPVIDGNLDDWNGSSPVRIDTWEHVKAGRGGIVGDISLPEDMLQREAPSWQGPEDLSGRAYLQWDEKYLYLAVAVKDDNIRIDESTRIFGKDCVELFINTERGFSVVLAHPIFQACFAPRDRESGDCRVYVFRTRESPSDLNALYRRTESGYVIEARIPWKESIIGKNLDQSVPTTASMDFSIIDADAGFKEGKKMKSKLIWSGETNNYRVTKKYGLVKMARARR